MRKTEAEHEVKRRTRNTRINKRGINSAIKRSIENVIRALSEKGFCDLDFITTVVTKAAKMKVVYVVRESANGLTELMSSFSCSSGVDGDSSA